MELEQWSPKSAIPYLLSPGEADNKYTRGVLQCVVGSRKFPGSALLVTQAALATGVGMVRFCGSRAISDLVVLRSPEVVTASGRTDAYVIGSGIASTKNLRLLRKMRKALDCGKPIVLDAGALYLAKHAHALSIITPHSGELATLLATHGIQANSADISRDPARWAMTAAQTFNITVLLKGHNTYLANPNRIVEMPQATSRLSTAGTGDVLAGILGGLLATSHKLVSAETLIDVGAAAVAVHTEAGFLASNQESDTPLVVGDLHKFIPRAIREVELKSHQ